MPMEEKSRCYSSELQRLDRTRASKAPERPEKSKGIFGCPSNSMTTRRREVHDGLDDSKSLLGGWQSQNVLTVPQIPPGPLMSSGAAREAGILRVSLQPQRARASMMPTRSASGKGVFGCVSCSKPPAASPGARRTRRFQRPLRGLARAEGLECTADTTGTFDVQRCCERGGNPSGFSPTSKSQGINDANEVCEWQRPLRMPELFKAPSGVARCTTDPTFSKASSGAGVSRRP